MKLNQVTVGVTDIPRAIDFYERLGMTTIVKDGHYARFELPSGDTFSVMRVPEVKAGTTEVFFEFDDVDQAVREAEARGIAFETPPVDESWLWRQTGTKDPDGNPIIFFHAGTNRRFPPWRVDGRTE